jgi:HemY protein
MIRIALYLILVGLIAYGIAWLADLPGDVVITLLGVRIKTTLLIFSAAVLAAVVVLIFLFLLIRAIVHSPYILSRFMRHRRGVQAYEAISNGLIAVGAGDVEAAQKHAATVQRIAPGEPLSLLLHAQSAQLSGDRTEAERVFRTMAGRPDTKPLGLHGLFVEAHRRNDQAGARAYAEEAARTAPSLGWASRAVLEARVKDGDWAGALALLEANARTLAKDIYRRQRAVLLAARAHTIENTDRASAKTYALEANKLAPGFVPAAALAGRLLAEGGDFRKAHRVIDKAWRANPHPELAQAYAEMRSGESARDKLKRIEALAKRAPDHIEGALAVARAALNAQEFAKVRAALASYVGAPTRRVAMLMAELERAEHNDEGRAREWLSRAIHAAPDPAWTADGHVSDRWLPASPVSGRLDALEWRVPLTGIVSPRVIEPELLSAAPFEVAAKPSAESTTPIPTTEVVSEQAKAESEAKLAPKAEPIIPLVHAPDDPGPDAVEEIDAAVESGGWRKIFG